MSSYSIKREVNSVSINDEGNLFVAATDFGIRIYNMEPLIGKLKLDCSHIGSISMCKLLNRTNMIAFVGGGSRARFADNTVLFWDASENELVLEYTFPSKVLNMIVRLDRLFVVVRDHIHCMAFPHNPSQKPLFSIKTRDNPGGLCVATPMTTANELHLLAYPSHEIGYVQLLNLTTYSSSFASSSSSSSSSTGSQAFSSPPSIPSAFNSTNSTSTALNFFVNNNNNGSNKGSESLVEVSAASVSISPTTVNAHQSELACLTLNRTGTLLATASIRGTLIRLFQTVNSGQIINNNNNNIYNASSGNIIQLSPKMISEFRRGLDSACIF